MADEIGLTKSFIMTTTTEYKSKEIHSTEPLISLESVIPYINFYSLYGKCNRYLCTNKFQKLAM